MADQFEASEILKIAQQIERNGAAFYRLAAKNRLLAPAAELLTSLSKMELRHVEVFGTMLKNLEKDSEGWLPAILDSGSEDVVGKYLRAAADGIIFDLKADPAEFFSHAPTPESILTAALGLEKDSVVFYVGVKEAVPATMGREYIDRIIQEEMSHITLLSRQLALYSR